jgi:hypothetical protein
MDGPGIPASNQTLQRDQGIVMNQGYGNELPRPHHLAPHRQPARFMVVIESAGTTVARLVREDGQAVAEFDAGTEEAVQMARGLVPVTGATGPEWDRALGGHSAAERAAALVYRLDL